MHGVKIFPSNSTLSETAGGSHQQRAQPGRKNDTVNEARSSLGAAPMDTNGATQGTPKLSKKQQREETRSAARLLEYQKGKAAQQRTARWLLLSQPLLRQARWMISPGNLDRLDALTGCQVEDSAQAEEHPVASMDTAEQGAL